MSDKVYKQCNKRNWVGFSMDAGRTFRVICYCGIIGVLVDIDHVIAWAVHYISNGETVLSSRFLHTPLLIGAGTLILIMLSYYSGLYIKYLLKGDKL